MSRDVRAPQHGRDHLPLGADQVLRKEIGFYTVIPNVGNPTSGNQRMAFSFGGAGSGTELLDIDNWGGPTGPVVVASGMYAINVRIAAVPDPPDAWPTGSIGVIDLLVNSEPEPENDWAQQATLPFPLDSAVGGGIGTTGFTRYLMSGGSGFYQFLELSYYAPGDYTASGFASVQRLF